MGSWMSAAANRGGGGVVALRRSHSAHDGSLAHGPGQYGPLCGQVEIGTGPPSGTGGVHSSTGHTHVAATPGGALEHAPGSGQHDGDVQIPSRSTTIRARGIAVLAAVVLGTAGCGGDAPGLDRPEAAAAAGAGGGTAVPRTATALQALEGLVVKGRAPTTGYDRQQFGQAWADVDRNGCDTRNDILRRDVGDAVLKEGTQGCVVLSGSVADPYSGTQRHFLRGEDTSSDVQVDHIVALSDGFQTGAQQLSEEQRVAFANDPLNLVAVDGPLNQQKSDSNAASWLPPNTAYRCTYVARQVAVKSRYGLWVTAAERDAIAAVLQGCPGQQLPISAEVATPPTGVTGSGAGGAVAEEAATEAPPAAPVPSAEAGGPVVYANCDEARAAGAAPISAGEPGYSTRLDGNDDGVACTS